MKLLLNITAVLILSGCAMEESYSVKRIQEATVEWVMQAASFDLYNRSSWPDEIKRLDPIEVYSDRVNIVIATQQKKNVEQGYYIYIPISSYLPTNNTEWTFTSVGDGIWTYTRKRSEPDVSGNG